SSLDRRGEALEDLVAGGMAELVVDRLEAVQVGHADRQRLAARRALRLGLEDVAPMAAVVAAGQGIDARPRLRGPERLRDAHVGELELAPQAAHVATDQAESAEHEGE